MFVKNKILIGFLLLSPVMANAATITNAKNAEADITFVAPNQFTHTLTALKNLTSGTFAPPTPVANGTINTTGNLKAMYALQFPVTPHIAAAGVRGISVTGKNNPANKITVDINKDMTAGNFSVQQINGTDWGVYDTPVDVFKYNVLVSGEVKPDVYPVTVSAAVYTN